MKKISNILIAVAAFLLIWFYIQPFKRDVDRIIDDIVYTQEEKELDDAIAEHKRFKDSCDRRDQFIIDSLNLETEKFFKKIK